MESVVLMPKRLKKTRLAEIIPVILGCVGSQYAIAQLTPPPPDRLVCRRSRRGRQHGQLAHAGVPPRQRHESPGADNAYAAGFAGQGINIGLVDSGYFLGHFTEHAAYPIPHARRCQHPDALALDRRHRRHHRLYSRLLQPGLQRHPRYARQWHGRGEPRWEDRGGVPAVSGGNNMHGVAFDAHVYFANTAQDGRRALRAPATPTSRTRSRWTTRTSATSTGRPPLW